MINHRNHPFLRFPLLTSITALLLGSPLLVRLARFNVSAETRVLLQGDQRNLSSYEKVKEILSDVEIVVISMECDEVFSHRGIDAVRRVSEAFEHQADVEDIKSLTHSSRPVRRGLSFVMVPLVPSEPISERQMAELKSFSLTHPLVRNLMVAPDSRHTVITVTYRSVRNTPESQRLLRREVDQILAPFRRQGLRFHVLALPLIEEEIRSTLSSDMRKFIPAAGLLVVVILWLTFRSWRVLLVVLLNQALLLVLLPGAIDLLGFSLNVFSVILFPLLTAIHLNVLAHFYSAYQRNETAAKDFDEAIDTTFREVLKACSFAFLTTLLGFYSLTFGAVSQVREFGLLGMVGVSLAFLITFGPGLAVLKLVTRRSFAFDRKSTDSAESRAGGPGVGSVLSRWALEYRRMICLGAVAALGVSAYGFRLVRMDIRAVEFLNRKSPTRLAVEELDSVYGGINVVQIEIDSGRDNGANQTELLKYLERLQEFADAQAGVTGTYSYAQLLAMMNQIWEGERPGTFQLPESPWLINLFVFALKSQNFPFLTALADKSFRTAYLIVRSRDMPSERYLEILEKIAAFAQETKPRDVTVSASRGIHSILEADRRILHSQLNSAFGSAFLIGIVLALLWRSLWLALLSLATNALPIGLVLAAAAYAQVPLNSITIMVAAVCLGIAVDDSIHFITHWRDQYRRGVPAQEAVEMTFRAKTRPIVFTSVILIAVFGIFWLSSFPPIVHFGLLSAFAFLTALVAVLFFLPAILTMVRRK